jgi:hypothetical protein
MKQFGGNLQPFSTSGDKGSTLELDLTAIDKQYIRSGLIRALAYLETSVEPDIHVQSAKGVKLTEPSIDTSDPHYPYESELSATFATLRDDTYAGVLRSKGLRYMPSYTRKFEQHKGQKINSWVLDNATHTQIGTQTHADVLDYLYQRLPNTTGLSTEFIDRPPETTTETSRMILQWLELNGATMTETQSFKGASLLVGQFALYETGAALSIARHKDRTVYSGSISTESEVTKALRYKNSPVDRTQFDIDTRTVGQMYHFSVNQPRRLDIPPTVTATLQTQAPGITSGSLENLTNAQKHDVDIEQIVTNMTSIVDNDVALRLLDL